MITPLLWQTTPHKLVNGLQLHLLLLLLLCLHHIITQPIRLVLYNLQNYRKVEEDSHLITSTLIVTNRWTSYQEPVFANTELDKMVLCLAVSGWIRNHFLAKESLHLVPVIVLNIFQCSLYYVFNSFPTLFFPILFSLMVFQKCLWHRYVTLESIKSFYLIQIHQAWKH